MMESLFEKHVRIARERIAAGEVTVPDRMYSLAVEDGIPEGREAIAWVKRVLSAARYTGYYPNVGPWASSGR